MSHSLRRTAVLALAALLIPGVAAAQPTPPPTFPNPYGDVPFEFVAGSQIGGPHQAGRHVIRDQQALDQLGVASLVPNGAVDFDREMLLAVFLGGFSNGGHAVKIHQVTQQPLFTTMPVNPPGLPNPNPPRMLLTVSVKETHPAPGMPVPMVLTQPYYIVKVRKMNAMVRFDNVDPGPGPAPGRNFDLVQLETSQPGFAGPIQRTVAILSNGEVEVRTANPLLDTGPPQTKKGMATAGELRQLEDAVKLAQMISVPDPIPYPLTGTPVPTFLLTVKSQDARHAGQTRGRVGFYGQTEVGQLLDLASRIGDRIQRDAPTPAGRNFDLVQLETSQPGFAGTIQRTVAITADGEVEVRSAHPLLDTGPARVKKGTATADELRQLEDAVKLAQMATVPANIPFPLTGTPVPMFRLVVKSQDARHEGQTRGRLGFYGQTEVGQLLELASRIGDRIQQTPAGRNFSRASLHTQIPRAGGGPGIGGMPISHEVVVDADGKVRVLQSHPAMLFAPVEGVASADELRRLEDAVKLAQLASVPNPLGVAIPMHLIVEPFTVKVASDDARHAGATSGHVNYLGQYEAQLRPLIAVLTEIGERVKNDYVPGGRTFDSLTRSVFRPNPVLRPLGVDPSIEVLWGTSETFEIDADGKARFTWSAPNVRTRPLEGQATAAELDALKDAIRDARLSTIPAHLPQPVHIVAAPTFELEVNSRVSGNDAQIDGELGYYEQWDGQLRPVMKAIDRIIERLRAEDGPKAEVAEGTVEVRGWYGFRTVHLVDGSQEFQVKPWSFASDLIKFEGHVAKVKGKIAKVDATRSIVTAEELLSPVRQKLRGNVKLQGDQALIEVSLRFSASTTDGNPNPGPNRLIPPLHLPVKTFGPAARVLTQAVDTYVTVDAWAFRDGFRVHEAYVLSVAAESEPGAHLLRRGEVDQRLTPGTPLKLLRLSRSGRYVRAELEDGTRGWVKVRKVSMGPRRLHTLPVIPFGSAESGGAAGALGDAGN